jgi:hypothetical protein
MASTVNNDGSTTTMLSMFRTVATEISARAARCSWVMPRCPRSRAIAPLAADPARRRCSRRVSSDLAWPRCYAARNLKDSILGWNP